MERVFAEYPGPRQEFVKDLQGRGFSARVWELALFAWLRERAVPVRIGRGSPDLLVATPAGEVAIEATTSNPPEGGHESTRDALQRIRASIEAGRSPLAPQDVHMSRNEFVLQLAKALRRKLLKQDASGRHYWELDFVQGHPFVIAVMAYHSRTAPHYGVSGLASYLYGLEHRPTRDEHGGLVVLPKPVMAHEFGGKRISSGMFAQPQSRFLSAVIFSNAGTASQFQRIAVERGIDPGGVRVFRHGLAWDPDPDAAVPRPFSYEVEPGKPRETFAQGLHVLHNPWAVNPLPQGALPGVVELYLRDDGQIINEGPEFQPFGSLTTIVGVESASGPSEV